MEVLMAREPGGDSPATLTSFQEGIDYPTGRATGRSEAPLGAAQDAAEQPAPGMADLPEAG